MLKAAHKILSFQCSKALSNSSAEWQVVTHNGEQVSLYSLHKQYMQTYLLGCTETTEDNTIITGSDVHPPLRFVDTEKCHLSLTEMQHFAADNNQDQ